MILISDQSVIDMTINDGGDIEEYHKRFSIDGVKVDFVVNPSSNIFEAEILKKDKGIAYNFLKVATLDALFELKSLLILDRNKIRDLYNLVYLIRYGNFSPKEILETIKKYRITYLDEHIIKNLEAKNSDEFDVETEGIMHPKMNMVEYDALKSFLLEALTKV